LIFLRAKSIYNIGPNATPEVFMILTRRAIAALAIALIPSAAIAHHGWSSFDTKKVLDHTGAVARSTYANPHGTLWMMKDGVELTIELAPVSRMESRGLKAEDVAPGKSIRVYAYQNTTDAKLHRAEWVEVGGKRIELR
jgi:hypothetical protein